MSERERPTRRDDNFQSRRLSDGQLRTPDESEAHASTYTFEVPIDFALPEHIGIRFANVYGRLHDFFHYSTVRLADAGVPMPRPHGLADEAGLERDVTWAVEHRQHAEAQMREVLYLIDDLTLAFRSRELGYAELHGFREGSLKEADTERRMASLAEEKIRQRLAAQARAHQQSTAGPDTEQELYRNPRQRRKRPDRADPNP